MEDKREKRMVDVSKIMGDAILLGILGTGLPPNETAHRQIGLVLLDYAMNHLRDGKADKDAVRRLSEILIEEDNKHSETSECELCDLCVKISGGRVLTKFVIMAEVEDPPPAPNNAA